MARPNKPWYMARRDAWVAKVGGRQYTLARGKKNRREADRALHRLLEERDSGKVLARPRDRATWALFDEFLGAKLKTVEPLTWEFYRRHLASFLASVGRNRLVSAITPEDVHDWLSAPRSMTRRGRTTALPPWGPSTRHGAIVAIKAAFSWGVKRKKIAENPVAEMKGPGIRQRKAVLDEPAVRRILAATRGGFRDLLEFMWETGCRPSEAMELESGHVRFDEGLIRMEGKTTGATGEDRVIYLTPRAAEILRRAAAEHPTGPVFRSARGNPWQRHAMAQGFARIRAKLGMGSEATAEAIRHAFGTDGAIRVKPMVLAELMGHTSVAMVSKYYAHLDERKEEMKSAMLDVRPDGRQMN